MTEKWRFIDFQYHDPAFNMALDELLIEWHSKGLIPPTLRFYGWNPAALSIGYFQKVNKEINLDKVKEHNVALVRRLTGGRAVLHDKELTYSIIVSEEHPLMPKGVTEAYRVISQGLLEGFRNLGLASDFSIPFSKEEQQSLKKPRSANCFDTPSWYELVVEGRKVAGSAQTRQKGVILQHGSIPIELDEDLLFDLFLYPNEKAREVMQKAFKHKAVTISELMREKLSMEQLQNAFMEGFAKVFDVELESYQLNEEEIAYVQALAQEKYQNDEWTYSR